MGSASFLLFDEGGGLLYQVRATLIRTGEYPPPGEAEQGGFHGTLSVIESSDSEAIVAEVEGKWILEPNGAGSFGADILVAGTEGGRDHMQLVPVGAIAGTLRAAQVHRGGTGAPGALERRVAALSRLSATWVVGS
jgi:hypothetical protein